MVDEPVKTYHDTMYYVFLHWWVRLSIVFEEYVTQSRYPCKSIRTLYRSKRDSELHHVAMSGLRVCWTQ